MTRRVYTYKGIMLGELQGYLCCIHTDDSRSILYLMVSTVITVLSSDYTVFTVNNIVKVIYRAEKCEIDHPTMRIVIIHGVIVAEKCQKV